MAVPCGLILIGYATTLYLYLLFFTALLRLKCLVFISVFIINVHITYYGVLMRPLR